MRELASAPAAAAKQSGQEAQVLAGSTNKKQQHEVKEAGLTGCVSSLWFGLELVAKATCGSPGLKYMQPNALQDCRCAMNGPQLSK